VEKPTFFRVELLPLLLLADEIETCSTLRQGSRDLLWNMPRQAAHTCVNICAPRLAEPEKGSRNIIIIIII
jgi:hypothetical protein